MTDLMQFGQTGERHAERFLRKLGYRTVTRNYRCSTGEIDLVVLDGKMIVFVEVKTRADAEHAAPQDAVTRMKQQRVISAAKAFIQQTHSQNRAFRFDVVAITMAGRKPGKIEHFQNAFSPAG